MIPLFSMMEYVGFDLFGQTDHNLSENAKFSDFLLSVFDIFSSKKARRRGFSAPVFLVSFANARDKYADAQDVDGSA